jgi:ketosteroid isomerase-like protein
MEGKTYSGSGMVQAYIDDIDATWNDWHTYDERVLDAGGEKVAQLYRVTGTGKGSGVRIDANIAIVYTLRNGLVCRGDVYLDQAEALEAVGLSEQDAHVDS